MKPKFNPGTNTLAKLAKVRTSGIFDVMVEKQTQPTLFSFQKKKDKPDQVKRASKSKHAGIWITQRVRCLTPGIRTALRPLSDAMRARQIFIQPAIAPRDTSLLD